MRRFMLLLPFVFGILCVANAQQEQHENGSEQRTKRTDTVDVEPPCACPLFPIMSLEAGDVYYCDYHESNCDAPPEAAYAMGAFPWPYIECSKDCIAARIDDVKATRPNDKPFTGLESPVDDEYTHQDKLPYGDARQRVRVSVDPSIQFIEYVANSRTHYAKVLLFSVELGSLKVEKIDNNGASRLAKLHDASRVRHIAFEMAGPPKSGKFEHVNAKPVYTDDRPVYAYSAIHQPTGAKPIPILILRAQ